MSSVERPTYTNKTVLEKYLNLPQGSRVCATYVWIDGSGEGMRSKVKCLDSKPSKVEDLPMWNYDGSSCYQVSFMGKVCFIYCNMLCCPRQLVTTAMFTFNQLRCILAHLPRGTTSSSCARHTTSKMSQ